MLEEILAQINDLRSIAESCKEGDDDTWYYGYSLACQDLEDFIRDLLPEEIGLDSDMGELLE